MYSGSSCDPKSQGGHHFDGLIDPWKKVKFVANKWVWLTVKTGLDLSDMESKIVIVHDSTAAKVACFGLGKIKQNREELQDEVETSTTSTTTKTPKYTQRMCELIKLMFDKDCNEM